LAGLAGLLALAGCAREAPPGPGLAGEAAPHLEVVPGSTGRLVTADGLELPLRRWGPNPRPPDAVVLALHGFNDYAGAFSGPAPAWGALGLAVYAFDQRGFGGAPHRGLWPGPQAMVADLRLAAELLRAKYPDTPLYLLGESMGGAVLLTAAGQAAEAGAPLPADGLILSAPAVWARSTQPWYQRAALWLGETFFPWATPSGRGLDIRASDNLEALIALGRDPLVIKSTRIDTIAGLVDLMDAALAAAPRVEMPVLLLYGARDELVPKAPTRRLWDSLADVPGARLAYYPEGWHLLFRDLQAAVPTSDVAAWVYDPRGALPSGADRDAAARLAADAAEEAAE
jgi:alpha-beta hydrolase superfamily lysophospholipase